MNQQHTRGFTLIELMIAMALSLIIMGVVAYAFSTTSRATTRGLELSRMHEQAATLYNFLRRDLDNRVPGYGFSMERYQPPGNPAPPLKDELRFVVFADEGGGEKLMVAYQIPMITADAVTLPNGEIAEDSTTPVPMPSTNDSFSVIRRSVSLANKAWLDDTNTDNDNSMLLLHYAAPGGSNYLWLPNTRGMVLCDMNRQVVKVLNSSGTLSVYTDLMRSDPTPTYTKIIWNSTVTGGYWPVRMSGVNPFYSPEEPNTLAVDVNKPVFLRIHLPFMKAPDGGVPTLPSYNSLGSNSADRDAARDKYFSRVTSLDGSKTAFAWYFKL